LLPLRCAHVLVLFQTVDEVSHAAEQASAAVAAARALVASEDSAGATAALQGASENVQQLESTVRLVRQP
jgi:hypothetical protein